MTMALWKAVLLGFFAVANTPTCSQVILLYLHILRKFYCGAGRESFAQCPEQLLRTYTFSHTAPLWRSLGKCQHFCVRLKAAIMCAGGHHYMFTRKLHGVPSTYV